jgi:hypothetical protein
VPSVPSHTEDFRQELLALGRSSLYLFAKVILGMADLTESLHLDLCSFLEGRKGPWRRALVCAFRGSLKSSLCTIAYPLWRGLYIPGYSTKLIEGSEDLARSNHFRSHYYDRFTTGDKAQFLYWLYSHRIPDDFQGWSVHQIQFKSPVSGSPSVSYAGLESKLEGYHGDLIVPDDLEGADAQNSEARNDAAWRKVAQATPLLRDPRTGQILVVGTPWGPSPLVWKIRRFDKDDGGSGTLDNKKRDTWKVWWKPIIGEDGKSVWPERFPDSVLPSLQMDRATWQTQYLLEERAESTTVFDMATVEAGFWKWRVPGQLLGYPAYEVDEENNDFKRDKKGRLKLAIKKADPRYLRYYIHGDPKHKSGQKKHAVDDRPARAAIVVVGVSEDSHAFVMEEWCSPTAGLEEFADKFFHFYRLYAPYRATMEPTGAQNWFWAYARELERGKYRNLQSLGRWGAPSRRLPKLTSVLLESTKSTKNKEGWIIEQLSSWFDLGLLHISADKQNIRSELAAFPSLSTPVDLLDALSHGPPLWQPPASTELTMTLQRRQQLVAMQAEKYTGYRNPWASEPETGEFDTPN